jgi:hypothetical protein
MKLKLTPEQSDEARKALAEGAERFGGDSILFGQVRLALAGEDHAGEQMLFAITIPPATGRKVRALLERDRHPAGKADQRAASGRVARGRAICVERRSPVVETP